MGLVTNDLASGYCAYFDVENSMDPSFAESMGVDAIKLLLWRPNSTENLLSPVDTLTKSGSLDVIVVDSVRFGAKYGQALGHLGETTCSGNALRFYAVVRLRLARRELMKRDDEEVGIRICEQVVKNKLAPNMKKAKLRILFGRGFDSRSDVFELACEHGIILREGSKYVIDGKVFRDRDEAQSYLAEQDSIFEKISKLLRQEFFES